ncbi:hypothetical protein H6P81_003063 [Aristolochia fimbriata]|uniref:C2 domain-containing protein n=1 Tax=Aristolochia fimbriata TaxID=158543 RepID=A0AAV7FBI2_ARIFI|nr:hypothetical protein H6P81_003063 [Aristolochia fimbriata]
MLQLSLLSSFLSFCVESSFSMGTHMKDYNEDEELNPEWNEKFKLTVKDPETQVLQLHVYDREKVGAHDKLGMQPKEFTLRLLKNPNPNDHQNKIDRGLIVVELTSVPFRR